MIAIFEIDNKHKRKSKEMKEIQLNVYEAARKEKKRKRERGRKNAIDAKLCRSERRRKKNNFEKKGILLLPFQEEKCLPYHMKQLKSKCEQKGLNFLLL